ncbi:unnamed protein product [Spirodela intermedia]|uniref:Hydrophobic seed protein domain-containing protein n=1 Tax=Spirodela intermedia TaxID=51605 RepID=A0A7I8K3E4_SPIIN|nr:unnamed protein product [Spirodela intermedia]
MATKASAVTVVVFLNLLLLTLVSAQGRPQMPGRPSPPPLSPPPPPPSPSPPPPSPSSPPPSPSPSPPSPSPPPPSPSPPPSSPLPPPPSPSPSPPPPSPSPPWWFPRRPPPPRPPPSPPPPSPSPPPPSPSPPPPSPSPPPPSPSPPPPPRSCPIFAFRLGVCAPVVNRLRLGLQASRFPCCTVINSLSDQQSTACLCLAARLRFLGLRVSVPGDVARLLTFCGRPVPSGLTCS